MFSSTSRRGSVCYKMFLINSLKKTYHGYRFMFQQYFLLFITSLFNPSRIIFSFNCLSSFSFRALFIEFPSRKKSNLNCFNAGRRIVAGWIIFGNHFEAGVSQVGTSEHWFCNCHETRKADRFLRHITILWNVCMRVLICSRKGHRRETWYDFDSKLTAWTAWESG